MLMQPTSYHDHEMAPQLNTAAGAYMLIQEAP